MVQILIVTFRLISTFSLVKWSNYVKFLVIQLTSTFSWWTSLISHHKFHGNSHETTSDDQRFLGLQPAAETPNRSMGMGVRFFTASLNMSWRRGRDNQTSSWIYVCISIYLPICLYPSICICIYRCNCICSHCSLYWYLERERVENQQSQPPM